MCVFECVCVRVYVRTRMRLRDPRLSGGAGVWMKACACEVCVRARAHQFTRTKITSSMHGAGDFFFFKCSEEVLFRAGQRTRLDAAAINFSAIAHCQCRWAIVGKQTVLRSLVCHGALFPLR